MSTYIFYQRRVRVCEREREYGRIERDFTRFLDNYQRAQ